MKDHIINDTLNPSYNNVLNLTNRTFDGDIVPGRGATEDQLLVVYNLIKDVKEFLERNGCSDDPFDLIKRQLDELEQAQAECCGTDWSAAVTQNMFERMADLEERIETCCTVDHGEIAIEQILQEIERLRQQVTQCCEELEERVQHVVDNIEIRQNSDGGTSREIIPEDPSACPDGLITMNYTLDTSGTWIAGSDQPKIVGQVSATIPTGSNKTITRFYFLPKSSNDIPFAQANPTPSYKTYVPRIRIDGHREILFKLDTSAGFIAMMAGQNNASGVTDEEDLLPRSFVDCCGNPIVGPNKIYTKLFVVGVDNDGCTWETEIPLSAFDFSGIDESGVPSSEYCPCYRNVRT